MKCEFLYGRRKAEQRPASIYVRIEFGSALKLRCGGDTATL
jgi:hypothetical protein